MKFIKFVFLIFVLLTLFIYSACNSPKDNKIQKSTIKIGVIAPFEGPNAHIGKMIMNSVELYFEMNPIVGTEIKLIPIDTKSNPPDAVAAVQSTVADSDIKAFIGFYHSSTALACKNIIKEAKVPTLIYSASNPTVTDNADYYFRMVPTDDNQAIVLANVAKELGAQKVGILYYADEYGKGLADGITKQAQLIGLSIVDNQSYDASTTDFRPVLTVMKGKNPEIVIICGFVEKSIAILNQAAEKGFKPKFLAGDGTFNEEQLVLGTGMNCEGVYVAAPYVFDFNNEKNRIFLENYWSKFSNTKLNKKPASWTAFAFDAAGIIAKALKNGAIQRNSIWNYLKNMNSSKNAYDGIVGLTYFNSKGDAQNRQFRLAVVRNQEFVLGK